MLLGGGCPNSLGGVRARRCKAPSSERGTCSVPSAIEAMLAPPMELWQGSGAQPPARSTGNFFCKNRLRVPSFES